MQKRLDYLLIGSLALVILTIPFRPIWGSYAIIALAITGVLNMIILKKSEKLPLFVYLLVAAYVVRVIWLFRAEDFSYGIGRLETEIPLLALPLIFSTFKVTEKIKNLAVKIYCLTMMSIMAYGFFRLFLYFQTAPYTFLEYTQFHLDPNWFWEDSRHFAQKMLTWDGSHYSFINISIIYGMHLSLYVENKTKVDKLLFGLYVIMTFLFLIYTGSRIGFFALVASVIGYFLFSIKLIFKKRWLFISIFFFLGFLFVLSLIKWGAEIEPVRYHYWSKAGSAIKEGLFLGHGTGAGRLIMHEPEFEQRIGWEVNHPHNQYLSELMQFGLLGSIPLFLFLMLTMHHGLRFKNRNLLSVLFTGMVFMVTEAPLNSNKGIIPFILILVILLNYGRSKQAPS